MAPSTSRFALLRAGVSLAAAALACAPGPPVQTPLNGVGENLRSPTRGWPTSVKGACSVSAAVLSDDGSLLLGDDESNVLLQLEAGSDRARPVTRGNLETLFEQRGSPLKDEKDEKIREIDIEGGALLTIAEGGKEEKLAVWIGSHSFRKAKQDNSAPRDPRKRLNREQLFATNLPASGPTAFAPRLAVHGTAERPSE